ncbi:MAG: hypothetical protein KME29_07960 [Calothrix sp. FI2-JRJ7]|jgi:hypothetical protein|nr:hypothetical protein [Calothrix sp. FI2-JRJ7]
MTTSTSFGEGKESQILHNLQASHKQEIDRITQTLIQITNLSEEIVKPHLNAMLNELLKLKQAERKRPFSETATADEWIAAFDEWVNCHRGLNFPMLSDEDISRESIYGERG